MIILYVLIMVGTAKADELNWRIILASRDTLEAISLIDLKGDSLGIDNARWIHVDSITAIIRLGRSQSRPYGAIGLLGGTLIGGLVGGSSEASSSWFRGMPTALGMAVGAIVGFAAGGLIGGLVDHDEVYMLSKESAKTKRQMIRWLIAR
jgi:hypothetical protein